MHNKSFSESFTLISWVFLGLSLVLVVTSTIFHSISTDKLLPHYKSMYPYYWFLAFLFANLSFIPALYKMGSSKKAFRLQIWYGVTAILIYAIFSSYIVFSLPHENTGPFLVQIAIFSAASAALGWVIHVQLSNRSHRKSHTLNLLMQSRISTEYQNHIRCIVKCFPPSVYIKKKDLKYVKHEYKYRLEAGKDTEDGRMVDAFAAVRYILNYFEFLAIGIIKDDLDEDLLYQSLSLIIVGMHERCEIYIKNRQALDPETFVNLDHLVDHWKKRLLDDKAKLVCSTCPNS